MVSIFKIKLYNMNLEFQKERLKSQGKQAKIQKLILLWGANLRLENSFQKIFFASFKIGEKQ